MPVVILRMSHFSIGFVLFNLYFVDHCLRLCLCSSSFNHCIVCIFEFRLLTTPSSIFKLTQNRRLLYVFISCGNEIKYEKQLHQHDNDQINLILCFSAKYGIFVNFGLLLSKVDIYWPQVMQHFLKQLRKIILKLAGIVYLWMFYLSSIINDCSLTAAKVFKVQKCIYVMFVYVKFICYVKTMSWMVYNMGLNGKSLFNHF